VLDIERGTSAESNDYVEFLHEGAHAVGAYRCADCGYGVTVHATLPRCPMCSATSWEAAAWSPFSRAQAG
jgi:rubrerythrin